MKLHAFRRLAHRTLRKYDRKIVRVRRNTANGVDLEDDLRIVIGREDPLCLDIGANEGQTIRQLQRTFQRPQIHAFEPSRAVFEKLKTQWFRRPVTFHSCALGASMRQSEFINYERSVMSSLLPLDLDEGNRFRDMREVSRELVEVQTVDRFIEQNELTRVDLLKIDTQGSDLAVLEGAAKALADGVIQTVLVELNFVPMYQGQAHAQEIVNFLAKHQLHLIDYYDKIREQFTLAWCTAFFGRR